MNKIVLRPSSLVTYINCPQKWYNKFILNKPEKSSVRSIIGTSIHKGAEIMWTESMQKQEKIINISTIFDSGIEEYYTQVKNSEQLEYEEEINNNNTAEKMITLGLQTFTRDLVPHLDIPEKVEHKVELQLKHTVVDKISGTIDYIGNNTIQDIKTSKRKIIASNYVLQQSLYKYLAEKNNFIVQNNFIQGIIFGKTSYSCSIDNLYPNVNQALYIIKNLLQKLDSLYKGENPKVLFAGNPSYYLCSNKYCPYYSDCEFVHGHESLSLPI